MTLLNRALRVAFDALLYPFRGLPSIVGLTVVSLLVGVGMLLLFKATSNQTRLAEIKRRIHAGLFEIRLFNDDLRAIFRAQGEILWANTVYLRYALVPMLWILPPLILIMGQLQYHYGYEGLRVGESALLEVDLREGSVETGEGAARPALEIDLPAGLEAQAPPVWIPSLNQMAWRLGATGEGVQEIGFRLGDEAFTKSVVVSGDVLRRSPERPPAGLAEQLLWTAEDPLPGSGAIERISISYPDHSVWFLGFRWHWIIVFFILTMVFAFALKDRLGVTI